MSMSMREQALANARRVVAYERVCMRRWLRTMDVKGDWNNSDTDALTKAVASAGGDCDAILAVANQEMVERIASGL